MTGFQIGDIVEHARRPRMWVVKSIGSQMPTMVTIVRDDSDGLRLALDVSPGDLQLIRRPVFNDGDDKLRWEGQPAVVRGDEGSHVRLEIDRTKTVRPFTGSGASLG